MDKPCQQCGEKIIKKKTESKARFAKRKFCSPECSYAYLKENRLGWWKKK